jgi:hypothetical protein
MEKMFLPRFHEEYNLSFQLVKPTAGGSASLFTEVMKVLIGDLYIMETIKILELILIL